MDELKVNKEIEVIPNFVDTDVFRRKEESDCTRSMLAQPGERLIMHISNMRPVKRLQIDIPPLVMP